MNAPQPIGGFGKLGTFCRKILAYAKSIDIQSIIIEMMPVGSTAPPTAEITNTETGKLVRLKLRSGSGTGGRIPFELVKSGEDIRVILGSVDFPHNDHDGIGPYPTDMFEGDDPPFLIDTPGTAGYAYLEVTVDTDTEEVTDLAINDYSSAQVSTDTIGRALLGSWSADGDDVLHVSGALGNQAYLYCGGHYFWLA